MKKYILTLIITCVSAWGFMAQCGGTDDYSKVSVGDKAPDFEVELLSGETVKLSELNKDKVVVITFWATWCPPCRAELATIQSKLLDKYKDKAFSYVAISRGEEQDVVREFINENNYTFPVGFDTDTEIYNLYANRGVPFNFVVDLDGKIALAKPGYSQDNPFKELIDTIEDILNSK